MAGSPLGQNVGNLISPAKSTFDDRLKSMNQNLKVASATAPSVSFMRRISSTFSSSVPRMWAMARCSGKKLPIDKPARPDLSDTQQITYFLSFHKCFLSSAKIEYLNLLLYFA